MSRYSDGEGDRGATVPLRSTRFVKKLLTQCRLKNIKLKVCHWNGGERQCRIYWIKTVRRFHEIEIK